MWFVNENSEVSMEIDFSSCAADASAVNAASLDDSSVCMRFFWQEKKINSDRNQPEYFNTRVAARCKRWINAVLIGVRITCFLPTVEVIISIFRPVLRVFYIKVSAWENDFSGK